MRVCGRLADYAIELERRRRRLSKILTARMKELESQVASLNRLLISLKACRCAGCLDENIYLNGNAALLLGLRSAGRELERIRGLLSIINSEMFRGGRPPEALLDEIFRRLEKMESPSLPLLISNLNMPLSMITNALLELEKRGKIVLIREKR